MFLYINNELVNEQPIGKCLTLRYSNMLPCLCTIGDKNVALPAKVLKYAPLPTKEKKKKKNKLISKQNSVTKTRITCNFVDI